MQVLISDANILIDLEEGSLLNAFIYFLKFNILLIIFDAVLPKPISGELKVDGVEPNSAAWEA